MTLCAATGHGQGQPGLLPDVCRQQRCHLLCEARLHHCSDQSEGAGEGLLCKVLQAPAGLLLEGCPQITPETHGSMQLLDGKPYGQWQPPRIPGTAKIIAKLGSTTFNLFQTSLLSLPHRTRLVQMLPLRTK